MDTVYQQRRRRQKRNAIVRRLEDSHKISSATKKETGDGIIIRVTACDDPPYMMRAFIRDLDNAFSSLIHSAWPYHDIETTFHNHGQIVYTITTPHNN